jgi:DNA-binding beta-propeller fold protein YncE
MKMKRTLASLLVFATLAGANTVAASKPGYHVIKKVSLPGTGGWDYVFVDAPGRRVYISHATQVEVLNADTFEPVGTIPNTPGVHGITVAPEFGRGFITAGKSDSVIIFDLKSLKPLSEVKVGKKPDAILYDSATKRVYAMNGDGDSASVINPADGKLVGTVALGGNPEFAVSDGKSAQRPSGGAGCGAGLVVESGTARRKCLRQSRRESRNRPRRCEDFEGFA